MNVLSVKGSALMDLPLGHFFYMTHAHMLRQPHTHGLSLTSVSPSIDWKVSLLI